VFDNFQIKEQKIVVDELSKLTKNRVSGGLLRKKPGIFFFFKMWLCLQSMDINSLI